MTTTTRHLLTIIGLTSIVLFTNLGGPQLWDRDEPRNAGCAYEMLERGDWVTPWFNNELRDHKPVLLYWFIMSAYSLFGVNEFGARFWSAALGVGTALLTYLIGRRLFSPRAGLWGAIALSSALMFDVAGRAATPDSLLIFFSTAAIAAYVCATFRDNGERISGWFPEDWWSIAAIYALMGFAVLAKGPVGLVVPTAVIGMFLLIVRLPEYMEPYRDWTSYVARLLRPFSPRHFLETCWYMRPFTAIAVSMAIALPWYVWVGVRTEGAFLEGFFFDHNLGRATSAMEGHSGSIFFYPATILIGFFPWSVFAGPTIATIVSRLRGSNAGHAGYLFCTAWIGVFVGLFTIASTKLPSYITPCYPAVALLTGAFIANWIERRDKIGSWWPKLAVGTLGLVGVGMLIAFPILLRRYLPNEMWITVVALIPLLGAAGCFVLIYRRQRESAATFFAVTAVIFSTTMFAGVADCISRYQTYNTLLVAAEDAHATPELSAFGALEPSWVFYAKRPIREWSGTDARGVAGYLAERRGRFTIVRRDRFAPLQQQLGDGAEVVAQTPYFLKDEKKSLLLVRYNPQLANRHSTHR